MAIYLGTTLRRLQGIKFRAFYACIGGGPVTLFAADFAEVDEAGVFAVSAAFTND